MDCPESIHVHAYLDGEVDAIAAARIEDHLAQCPQCRSLREELGHMRTAIRQDVTAERAPPALRARITQSLDREVGATRAAPRPGRTRPIFAWSVFSALGGAAAACALMLFLPGLWRGDDKLLEQLVNAHVRSLMPARLIEVESSDHHTVKPWFAGRADVSPTVADFATQGYPLVGGRADFLDRQRAAVLVYRHGRHLINVFNWAIGGQSMAATATRDGYRVSCWRTGTIQSCAVSDTGRDELERLARLLQELAARED